MPAAVSWKWLRTAWAAQQFASLCPGQSVCLAGAQGAFKACPVYWVARDVHSLKRPLLSYHQLWQSSWCTVSATPSFPPSPAQLQLSVVFHFVFCYLTISWPLLCTLLEQFSNPHTTQLSWEPWIQPKTPPAQPPLWAQIVTQKVPGRPVPLRPPAACSRHVRLKLEEVLV